MKLNSTRTIISITAITLFFLNTSLASAEVTSADELQCQTWAGSLPLSSSKVSLAFGKTLGFPCQVKSETGLLSGVISNSAAQDNQECISSLSKFMGHNRRVISRICGEEKRDSLLKCFMDKLAEIEVAQTEPGDHNENVALAKRTCLPQGSTPKTGLAQAEQKRNIASTDQAEDVGKDLFKVISAGELNSILKNKLERVFLYDVNVDSTRNHVGVIPGAQLIDPTPELDVTAILPKDKESKIIFYCANKICSSSPIAATRSIQLGYVDVSVMTDGIYGWRKAGLPTVLVRGLASAGGAISVEPSEVNSLVKHKKAIIVDVREEEERHEIIAGEVWFPMSKAGDAQVWNEFKNKLPKNRTIIFHCAAGFRARKMAEKLNSEGVKSLYFVGVDQWKSAGLPLAKGPAE